jgi:hypothetical protein
LQIINFLILNMCNNLNQRKTLLLIDKWLCAKYGNIILDGYNKGRVRSPC